MNKESNVRVNLAERSYDIAIGSGNRQQLAEFLRERTQREHAVIITDSNVDQLYADALGDVLTADGWEVQVLIVEPGEPSKSIETCEDLWETMLNEGADRHSIVVAVGGGVVGDLAGFVAATFTRGLEFFQVPTTLLSQVDSSVGGKTGVNLPGAKNMVGCFWQPLGVLIDVEVLTTLPDREYRAGLAEVVKYGVILDEPFFAYLEDNAEAINAKDPAVLTEIIRRSCELKAKVVEADELEAVDMASKFEGGKLSRAILNYGHTFAHAFEAITGYESMLHGEAVAVGMRCAARLAEKQGRVDAEFVQRQDLLLAALGLSVSPPEADPEDILHLMSRDKKSDSGAIRFILPTKMGHVELVSDFQSEDVIASLSF
ncbi:3-dehydroquinate synthase [Adhaeretor mobilis]|uniref:3-dehydroquinate synthase n=1 Tax=Adhaeretor mobilis TaxID=1930276 RepID=A0A517N390_9BACT|nr:3-dehydroquinate synthase [Adhaeretor mobilis]QDT01448.1 3-dehydroquinate synthase [Adhaeretor mobilis]